MASKTVCFYYCLISHRVPHFEAEITSHCSGFEPSKFPREAEQRMGPCLCPSYHLSQAPSPALWSSQASLFLPATRFLPPSGLFHLLGTLFPFSPGLCIFVSLCHWDSTSVDMTSLQKSLFWDQVSLSLPYWILSHFSDFFSLHIHHYLKLFIMQILGFALNNT